MKNLSLTKIIKWSSTGSGLLFLLGAGFDAYSKFSTLKQEANKQDFVAKYFEHRVEILEGRIQELELLLIKDVEVLESGIEDNSEHIEQVELSVEDLANLEPAAGASPELPSFRFEENTRLEDVLEQHGQQQQQAAQGSMLQQIQQAVSW